MKLQSILTIVLILVAGFAIFKAISTYNKKPEPNLSVSQPLANEPAGLLEGNENAPLVIYKFFDYSCQFCKQSAEQLTTILKDFNQKFKIIHTPLSFGNEFSPNHRAASISACEYDSFGELSAHHFFYNHQENLEVALDSGLTTILHRYSDDEIDIIQNCMDSPLYSEWLETNRSIAQQVGLSSVPALLIDTDIYIGTYSGRQLQSIINSYLTDDN